PVNIGSYRINASFAGNSNYNPVSDNSLRIIITKADTTTVVTSQQNPSYFGQAVPFRVAVAPIAPGGGTPIGTVQLFIDGASGPTGALIAGVATINVLNVNLL